MPTSRMIDESEIFTPCAIPLECVDGHGPFYLYPKCLAVHKRTVYLDTETCKICHSTYIRTTDPEIIDRVGIGYFEKIKLE